MHRMVCVILVCVAASAAPSLATITSIVSRGYSGSGIGGNAPGASFSMDYRSGVFPGGGVPYDLRQIEFFFISEPTFDVLNIQLDSSPTVFQLLPDSPVPTQAHYIFYDPALTTVPSDPWPISYVL